MEFSPQGGRQRCLVQSRLSAMEETLNENPRLSVPISNRGSSRIWMYRIHQLSENVQFDESPILTRFAGICLSGLRIENVP